MAQIRSAVTRESAIFLSSLRPSLRAIEELGRNAGFQISKSALNRAEAGPWHELRHFNEIITSYAAAEIAEELAINFGYPLKESDILDVTNWFALNHLDPSLREAEKGDPIWDTSAALAQEILRREATSRLMNEIVRASASLHLARNPNLCGNDQQASYRNAMANLAQIVASYRHDYAQLEMESLHPQDTFHSQPESDISGVLFSTALHLHNQAHAQQGEEAWVAQLRQIQAWGLLPQMAVRGVFFREPETLVNTSEASWVLGDKNAAILLLQLAQDIEPDLEAWIKGTWSKFLEPGFVVFSLRAISRTNLS